MFYDKYSYNELQQYSFSIYLSSLDINIDKLILFKFHRLISYQAFWVQRIKWNTNIKTIKQEQIAPS